MSCQSILSTEDDHDMAFQYILPYVKYNKSAKTIFREYKMCDLSKVYGKKQIFCKQKIDSDTSEILHAVR